MMATVPHVTSGLGLTKFQADGFLLTRVYNYAPSVEAAASTVFMVWPRACCKCNIFPSALLSNSLSVLT